MKQISRDQTNLWRLTWNEFSLFFLFFFLPPRRHEMKTRAPIRSTCTAGTPKQNKQPCFTLVFSSRKDDVGRRHPSTFPDRRVSINTTEEGSGFFWQVQHRASKCPAQFPYRRQVKKQPKQPVPIPRQQGAILTMFHLGKRKSVPTYSK